MSLCTEVNLDLLNKCFDLGPLHGLRKPHPDDLTCPPAEPGKYALNDVTCLLTEQGGYFSYSDQLIS